MSGKCSIRYNISLWKVVQQKYKIAHHRLKELYSKLLNKVVEFIQGLRSEDQLYFLSWLWKFVEVKRLQEKTNFHQLLTLAGGPSFSKRAVPAPISGRLRSNWQLPSVKVTVWMWSRAFLKMILHAASSLGK